MIQTADSTSTPAPADGIGPTGRFLAASEPPVDVLGLARAARDVDALASVVVAELRKNHPAIVQRATTVARDVLALGRDALPVVLPLVVDHATKTPGAGRLASMLLSKLLDAKG